VPISERTTRELVALMVAATVCVVVMGTGLALVIVALASPDTDTGRAGETWAHAVGVLFGITVGYLLGRRDVL